MPAYPTKWYISWISFFDNELHMDECYAVSHEHALKQAYARLTDTEYEEECNVDVRQAAFDCDGMIAAFSDNYTTSLQQENRELLRELKRTQ
jgi:hypothetical protein